MEDREKDPSYGMIRICRSQGSAHALFGSSIKHSNTIHMQISRGAVRRELHNDWFFEDDTLLEIEMSPTQFADAITSIGSSVPCTISWEKGVGPIHYPDYTNKKEEFRNEFNQHVDEISRKAMGLINSVSEIFSKKNITKTDKEEVMRKLNALKSDISSNEKYIAKCFDEQMEKSVVESKGEIEAFWQNKLNDIAMKAISATGHNDFLSESNPTRLLEDEGGE